MVDSKNDWSEEPQTRKVNLELEIDTNLKDSSKNNPILNYD